MSDLNLDEKAFPFYAADGCRGCPGMTLYDYYLGQSVIAIMHDDYAKQRQTFECIANLADALAIELLKVRAERMAEQ